MAKKKKSNNSMNLIRKGIALLASVVTFIFLFLEMIAYKIVGKNIITGKKFENPVVISNYPVDIHSNKQNTSILEKVNQEYQLPLESLMVKGFDNLFVIGRCLSAEPKAQAALRIIPSCFSMGEGLAKYLATIKN